MYQQPFQRSKPTLVTKPEHQTNLNRNLLVSLPVLQLQRMAGNQTVLQLARRNEWKPRRKIKRNRVSKTRIQKNRNSKPRHTRKIRRSKYIRGMHGGKKTEQNRLSSLYNFSVSGDTHESEHVIGFEPLNQTSGMKRGEGSRARQLENTAWAYQEVRALHRGHIGTGSRLKPDGSGFNSRSYRDTQRGLIEAGDVSSAVQINQLGYAFLGNSKKLLNKKEGKIANDSYDQMVTNMDEATYAQGDQDVKVPVDAKQRAEMYLARRAMISGQFPTREEENAAREKFGLPLLPESEQQQSDTDLMDEDQVVEDMKETEKTDIEETKMDEMDVEDKDKGETEVETH